jgi:hypothetical protein
MYPGIVANNTILSSSLNVVIPQTNSSSFYGAAVSSTGNAFRIIPGIGNNLTLAFNNTGVTTIKHSAGGGGSYTNPGTGESSSIQLTPTYMNLSTSDTGFGHITINAANSASITAANSFISSSTPVKIYSILNLVAVAPLPSGNTGDMAVSASNLYFYSGSGWKKVSLIG